MKYILAHYKNKLNVDIMGRSIFTDNEEMMNGLKEKDIDFGIESN